MDVGALWRVPVTYGAIGGTRADDLMQYPPPGYRPMVRRVRIGHGAARWEHAWIEALSWGVQKRSGLKVVTVEAPAEVTAGTYAPVSFDDAGAPVHPANGPHGEDVFAADGSPLARPGDTAIMRSPLWPRRIPVRVVYVIDEPTRKGLAFGTLPGHPAQGEEALIVDYLGDDSVWLTIRSFSRPASWFLWVGYPIMRLVQAIITSRYERALRGPIEGESA